MKQVQLIADTNVLSYIFKKSPLGAEYKELIGPRHVGLTGCSIAELRRGAALAQWGERRLLDQRRFLDTFSHVPDTREMAELCGAIHAARFRCGPVKVRRALGPESLLVVCASRSHQP